MNLKPAKIPTSMTLELAELIGIHLGDGSLVQGKRSSYTISYYGNLQKDAEYMEYVQDLFFKIFEVHLKKGITIKKGVINLRVRSKLIFDFFVSNGIKPGKKTDLSVPSIIKSDKKWLKEFIRGLFDTDGCVTQQKDRDYMYVLIKIATIHVNLAYELKAALKELGIKSFVCGSVKEKSIGYDVAVRHKNTIKFMSVIGSNNKRNIQKYQEMLSLKWGRQDLNLESAGLEPDILARLNYVPVK